MTTFSFGISAHNEADTLPRLLRDIQEFKQGDDFTIDEIVVISDGSTDGTCESARMSGITLIEGKEQKGKAVRMQEIMNRCTSDYLMLLDADIRVPDSDFLSIVSREVVKEQADLTGIKVLELKPQNLTQTSLKVSMDIKRDIIKKWNSGDNVYTCHGRCRVLSRRYYTTLKFVNSIAEDSYSHIVCKKENMKYLYLDKVSVSYRLPFSMSDHLQQSTRFKQSQSSLEEIFGSDVIKGYYSIPKKLLIVTVLKYLLANPIAVLAYLFVFFYSYFYSLTKVFDEHVWVGVRSSKI